MKRFLSILIVFSLCFGLFISTGSDAATKKKRKVVRKAHRRSFYVYKKIPVKLYQEMYLSPKVSDNDMLRIVSDLKEKGVNTAKIDTARNSLIVQYSSKTLSAVDIMQTLKMLGYTVTSID